MMFSRSEFKLFFANKLNFWLIISYFVIGIAAISLGNISQQNELSNYAVAEQHYQHDLAHYHQQIKQDKFSAGYLGYYLLNPAALTPNAWSSLFRGERDETSNHTRLRVLGLQSQVNAAPPGNIAAQQYGQFDLAFLWLYLMPLMIAAMSINTLADEKNSGRWPMLVSQVPSGIRLIINKLAIPALVIALSNLGLLIAATQLTPVVVNVDWLYLLIQILLYQFCWLSICAWIIFLDKQASFNYLVFLSIWLIFSFFVPGLSYLYQAHQQQAGQDAALVFEQRQYMNDSWDKDKQADFTDYLQQFPQWKPTKALAEGFDWRWYYTQQHMSDVVVEEKVQRRKNNQLSSYQQGQIFAWFSPVLAMQYSVNRLADSDLLSTVSFNQQLQDYHQSLRDYLWEFYFHDKAFTGQDIDAIPRFEYQPEPNTNTLMTVLKLFTLNVILLIILRIQLRRFEP